MTAPAETSTSWNARAYAPNWPVQRLSLDASVRGFDGPYLSGWAPMLGGTVTTAGRTADSAGGRLLWILRDQPAMNNVRTPG